MPEIQVRRRPARSTPETVTSREVDVNRPARPLPTEATRREISVRRRQRRDRNLGWLIWPLLGLGALTLLGLALANTGQRPGTVVAGATAVATAPPIATTTVQSAPTVAATTGAGTSGVAPATGVGMTPPNSVGPSTGIAPVAGAPPAVGTPAAAGGVATAGNALSGATAVPTSTSGAGANGPALPTTVAAGSTAAENNPAPARGPAEQAEATPTTETDPGLSGLAVEQVVTGLPLGDPEKVAALAGRRVRLTNVRVRQLHGDQTFWIGPSRAQRILVFLREDKDGEQDVEGGIEVKTGQIVNLIGAVRRLPGHEELRNDWSLNDEELAALDGEQVYIHIDDLRDFRVVGP